MGGPSELRPSVVFSPSCLDPVVYLYNFQWACWLAAEVLYLESFLLWGWHPLLLFFICAPLLVDAHSYTLRRSGIVTGQLSL